MLLEVEEDMPQLTISQRIAEEYQKGKPGGRHKQISYSPVPRMYGLLFQYSSPIISVCSTTILAFIFRFLSFSNCDLL